MNCTNCAVTNDLVLHIFYTNFCGHMSGLWEILNFGSFQCINKIFYIICNTFMNFILVFIRWVVRIFVFDILLVIWPSMVDHTCKVPLGGLRLWKHCVIWFCPCLQGGISWHAGCSKVGFKWIKIQKYSLLS